MTRGECWCGETHPERSGDPAEAWTTLWHEVFAAWRIPQLADWLTKRLTRH